MMFFQYCGSLIGWDSICSTDGVTARSSLIHTSQVAVMPPEVCTQDFLGKLLTVIADEDSVYMVESGQFQFISEQMNLEIAS